MQRVASILAHVLASSVLVACGGAVSDVADQEGTPSSSGGTTTGSSGTTPGKRTPDKRPPKAPTDAGVPDSASPDAGCTSPPVLVSSGGAGCADVWQSVCGVPADVIVDDGLSAEECAKVCGTGTYKYWGCAPHLTDDLPGPSFDCYTCVEGRRPEGYVSPAVAPSIAGWLAHAADLERVSIDAFQILRRELEHHRAPASLVRRAERAEADEVRHTRALSTLARREGATLSSLPVVHRAVRSLYEIALENAVEGCIRETYGALVAGWQAEHAERAAIRRTMRSVYADETQHAELAWDVHAWLVERLTSEERACLARAMTDAVADLARGASTPVRADLVRALGLPAAAQARRLVGGLEAQLFTAALAA